MDISFRNFASISAVDTAPPRGGAQVPDNWNVPMIILWFGCLRSGHSDHGISHAMIVVNHIDNNLFNPTLGDKLVSALSGLS